MRARLQTNLGDVVEEILVHIRCKDTIGARKVIVESIRKAKDFGSREFLPVLFKKAKRLATQSDKFFSDYKKLVSTWRNIDKNVFLPTGNACDFDEIDKIAASFEARLEFSLKLLQTFYRTNARIVNEVKDGCALAAFSIIHMLSPDRLSVSGNMLSVSMIIYKHLAGNTPADYEMLRACRRIEKMFELRPDAKRSNVSRSLRSKKRSVRLR